MVGHTSTELSAESDGLLGIGLVADGGGAVADTISEVLVTAQAGDI